MVCTALKRKAEAVVHITHTEYLKVRLVWETKGSKVIHLRMMEIKKVLIDDQLRGASGFI